MSLTEQQLESIVKRLNIEPEESKLLRKHLKRKKIQRLSLRQVLCEQNQEAKNGYYLLKGTVNLIATLKTGQKVFLSQINQQEFLNLQTFLDEQRSKYSMTVATPSIEYITLDEKTCQLIAKNLRQQLIAVMRYREEERVKREKRAHQQQRRRRLQKQIDKLKLPSINFQIPPKSIVYLPQNNTLLNTTNTQITPFSQALKNRSKSTTLLKKDSDDLDHLPESYDQQHLKAVTQHLLDNYHHFKDKIVEKKLQRMNSERSQSMPMKASKDVGSSRNQKIFKEHLKNIVRRKIVFERKHFKILKNLNRDQFTPKQLAQPTNHRYQDNNTNPIDNYFDF